MSDLSEEFLKLCHSVTAKRPKTVIDHILQHGFITSQDLKELYGYNHPPRAVRDVREHDIPIVTYRVIGSDGRKIAAYRFGDEKSRNISKVSGRIGLSKKIKDALVEKHGSKCFIYLEEVSARDLQIDHRIPYEIGGEVEIGSINPEDFMLLCNSANRAKSWSCEHCDNWNNLKDRTICHSCYWAFPEQYSHIAMRQIRRIDLIWQGEEIETYEKLKAKAIALNQDMPKFVKDILKREMYKRSRNAKEIENKQ